MMDCVTARDLMLEADLDELRGLGDESLARHLIECSACARVAAVLVEETERLDAALRASGPAARDVGPLIRRAGLDVEGTSAPHPWSRARTAVGGALAVAAAAAALWLLPAEGPPPAPQASAAVSAALPVVESAPGRNVAVLTTRNPDITVVMLLQPTGTTP